MFSGNLSFTKNPDNNWQVGYTLSDTLDVSNIGLCTFADTGRSVPLWHPATGTAGYYPYTGQNRDTVSRIDESQRWAARPGQIVMEGSNSGQYSLLRFVSPAPGRYHVKVVFEGVHVGLSTTDVHVLVNTTRLFSDIIDGYGGDPAFHKITGSHPSVTYEAVLYLNQNDILTFAVGYGANKNHYNDTTGLLLLLESA